MKLFKKTEMFGSEVDEKLAIFTGRVVTAIIATCGLTGWAFAIYAVLQWR